jgi:hypothetical protein
MPSVPFEQLPSDARLWVFPAHRPLSSEEEGTLLSRVDAFLEDWAAHGVPLTAGRDWRDGRFLLIAVDESAAPPSGCSIDSLARVLKELGGEWGTSFLDHSPVWFRGDGEVRRASRSEFKALAGDGQVDLDTPVFDNTITRVSQLLDGEWEKPAGSSWHRRAFFPNAGNGSGGPSPGG